MNKPLQQSKRYVLAIDLGSGGHKAAIVADSGEVIASAEGDITTHLLPHGGAEQDPAQSWDGVKQAARQVIRESKVAPEDIVAIGCDSQWSVVVPVDENMEPLMRAVHWMDTRGGQYNCNITAGFPSIQGYGLFKLLKWIKLTGLVPTHSGMDSLGHVLFIKQVDDPVNTTVRGTALLALITLGFRAVDEIPGLVRFKQVFEPDDSNREAYDRMYTQYRALFKKNRKIFSALNG